MFKILIAEDDSELRQLFSHVLIKNGYSVTGVCNGKEALDALDKGYYDLIISDIMMPEMDGYELVSSLRTAGYSIPVMMITAKDAFDDMRMGFVSGTDDYMVSPSSSIRFWPLSTARMLLSAHPSLKALPLPQMSSRAARAQRFASTR